MDNIAFRLRTLMDMRERDSYSVSIGAEVHPALVDGMLKGEEVSGVVINRVCEVLSVKPEWLIMGLGEAPVPIPKRPGSILLEEIPGITWDWRHPVIKRTDEALKSRPSPFVGHASVFGMSASKFESFMSGNTVPSKDFFVWVANVLGVRPEWLLEGEGDIEDKSRLKQPSDDQFFTAIKVLAVLWDDFECESVDELADRLGVPAASIPKWLGEGYIPPYKLLEFNDLNPRALITGDGHALPNIEIQLDEQRNPYRPQSYVLPKYVRDIDRPGVMFAARDLIRNLSGRSDVPVWALVLPKCRDPHRIQERLTLNSRALGIGGVF